MTKLLALMLGCALASGCPAVALAQQAATVTPAAETHSLQEIIDQARALDAIETLLVARDGRIIVEEGFRSHSTRETTNIKSASKSIVSALVGIAIEKGILEGVEQEIAPILKDKLPKDPDPRLEEITIGHLLSMQAGLGRTSGPNYGRWIASRDWVAAALARPFEDEPGGNMLYSTGSTHLLSAILTRKGGRSTLELAREWLKPVPEFRIGHWQRDPQGIYLGGNQMAMSPRSMLAFGELYRNRGRAGDVQVIPEAWIEQSWTPRTRSFRNGDEYGYGWFITRMEGSPVYYAWGFGGQMIYVAPEENLTVVMTSDDSRPSARTGYLHRLHALMGNIVAAVASEAESATEEKKNPAEKN
jgi:CubicO group peptidase (beta-lactamase class C family)